MRSRVAIVALCVVYLATRLFWLIDGQRWTLLDSDSAGGLLKIVVFVVPGLIAVMALHGRLFRQALDQLGIDSRPIRGIRFGLVATLPMALVVPFALHRKLDPDAIIGSVILGPFAEELLFRGFLFTALHKYARWPLPWAIAMSALAFGCAHVPDLQIRLPEIAVTALGGAVFAWVFYRSGSLWPAIALHGFMNLWWILSRNQQARIVLTPDVAGVAQTASIALAVLLTLGRWPGLVSGPATTPVAGGVQRDLNRYEAGCE